MTEELIKLAERVEAAGTDLTCPLCGESDYDIVGLATHVIVSCEVADVAIWKNNNAEVAASLRARASTSSKGES